MWVRVRGGVPQAPPEIREAVELYARKGGRHATVHFAPLVGWFVRFTLRANDPRLRAYREGRSAEPGYEEAYFHVKNPFEGRVMSIREVKADRRFRSAPLIDWHAGRRYRQAPYLQLDILQLGVTGVLRFLEREDTWSGRGEFSSLTEATEWALERNREGSEALRRHSEQRAADRALEERRRLLGTPFVSVGTDLRERGTNHDRQNRTDSRGQD